MQRRPEHIRSQLSPFPIFALISQLSLRCGARIYKEWRSPVFGSRRKKISSCPARANSAQVNSSTSVECSRWLTLELGRRLRRCQAALQQKRADLVDHSRTPRPSLSRTQWLAFRSSSSVLIGTKRMFCDQLLQLWPRHRRSRSCWTSQTALRTKLQIAGHGDPACNALPKEMNSRAGFTMHGSQGPETTRARSCLFWRSGLLILS